MSTRGFVGFIHNGEIKGWYNHYDSFPGGLGYDVLKTVYCKYSWETIKDFLINRTTFDDKKHHCEVLTCDWEKDHVTLQQSKDFYKNGLFCEYAYIFDLDSPKKKLRLFKGFGKKPDKSRPDWYHQSSQFLNGEKYYVNQKGIITGELPLIIADATMTLKYKYNKELRQALTLPKKELPILIGSNETVSVIIEYRLKKGK